MLMGVVTGALWPGGLLIPLQNRGGLLRFSQPHGSGNPVLNFYGCFCRLSCHCPMLLVSKEDKRLFI